MTVSAVPHYIFQPGADLPAGVSCQAVPAFGRLYHRHGALHELSFYLDVIKHSLLPALSLVIVGIGGRALSMRGMMVTIQGETI